MAMNKCYFYGFAVITVVIANVLCITQNWPLAKDDEYERLLKQYDELCETVVNNGTNAVLGKSVMTVTNDGNDLNNIANWYSNGVIMVKNVKIIEWKWLRANKVIKTFPFKTFKLNDVVAIPRDCMLEFEFNNDTYRVNEWCKMYNGSDTVRSFVMNERPWESKKLENTDVKLKLECGCSRECKRSDHNKCYIKFVKCK